MGRIKNYLVLILLAAICVSCEKENLDLPDEEAMAPKDLTFLEFLNSGIDIEDYYKKVSEKERMNMNFNKSHSLLADSYESYFEEYCSNLPVEDFEESNIDPGTGSQFLGPLSEEHSNTTRIQAEDIESGLLITTDADRPVLAIFGEGYRDSDTKVVVGTTDQAIELHFSGDDVYSVGLDISSFPYPDVENTQEVTIEVLYASGEIHEETITASIDGTFWGITGDDVIEQITISSTNEDAWIGVDNIAFGTCEVPDSDGDGCVDTVDPIVSSNMETIVIIGGCDSGVANRLTSECGISLSDLVDGLEDAPYSNKGAFVSAFAHSAEQWVSEGLITDEEKDRLVSCAANATI